MTDDSIVGTTVVRLSVTDVYLTITRLHVFGNDKQQMLIREPENRLQAVTRNLFNKRQTDLGQP